jgi:hypothetical protein
MDKIVELLRTSFIYGSCRHIANEYVEFLESITRFMDNDLYEKLERFIINEIEKHGTGTNALMAFHDAYAKAVKKYNDEQQEKKRIQNIIDEEYQLCRGCYNYKSSSGGRCPMAPKRDCAAYIAN